MGRNASGLVSIYVLIDPRDGEIRYVGQTVKSLRERVVRHISEARTELRKDSHRLRWLRGLARQGYRPLIHEVQAVPGAFYAEAEVYWIAYYRAIGCRLVNSTDGGDGTTGYIPSPEVRAKHAAIVASPEHRAKVSAGLAGKPKSRAHVEAQAAVQRNRKNPMKGLHYSEEEKERLYAHRRQPATEERKDKIRAVRMAERLVCPGCSMVTNSGCMALHRKASGH